jgi:copper chaperone CopZ
MATYLHAIDGRIRVRFPEIRGNRRAAARLRRDLRALSGVTKVEANPLTGSVLVEYDSNRLSADDVFESLDVELPADGPKQGTILKTDPSDQGKEVRDAVAEKVIEFAAERLLLAALA